MGRMIDDSDPIVLLGLATIVTVLPLIVSIRVMTNCIPSPRIIGRVNVRLLLEASTT